MRKLLLVALSLTGCIALAQEQDFESDSIAVDAASIATDTIINREFSPDFKEKYQGNEFVYELQAVEKTWWDQFLEWLTLWFRNLFDIDSDAKSAKLVDTLLNTIAVVIVLAVVYFIVRALLNSESKWIFGRNLSKKLIRYDEVEKNLKITDFEALIKETLSNGESRLAIRYYYLWLLKKLSEKEIIQWDPDKTNSEYQYEIKDEVLKDEFSYLSYLYNYIWYGEFELDEATFGKARNAFEKSIQSIR